MPTSDFETLLYTTAGPVATITLNRPEQLNTIVPPMPDEIEAVTLAGAPLAIGQLLKRARLAPSTSEALRLVEQGGVRIDGAVVSDKALKIAAGTFVVQVGKRKFARVTLS